MIFTDKNILIIGSGISGMGALKALSAVQAHLIVFDGNEKLTPEDISKKLPEGCEAEIIIGVLSEEVLHKLDMAVVSPGVPIDSPLVNMLHDHQIPVIGEIELGYQLAKGRLIGITGTNGKTTTTTLVGQMMQDYYESVFVVGNIGNPYTLEALKTTENSVTVAEISSFQLESVEEFCPEVSAILNVTPDHLDRHYTMANYAGTKEKITKGQTKAQYCILNYENDYTRDFGLHRCPATVVFFSSARVLEEGIYCQGDTIYIAKGGQHEAIMNIHTDMNLVGTCNVENVMAALGIGLSFGLPLESLLRTIKTFKAVEHRIEFVATKSGVDYYNDSKGTNPDAAIQGILAMNKPTILIGGGYDKHSEYDEWIEAFGGKVKLLVLIGQTREKIAACAEKRGFTDYVFADTFEECLKICTDHAKEGDAVLLSPACASWGMFPNYEERGRQFKDYVRSLS
ncbi:MAG: UDP-N-acetylmuramoyl-L-alanine--D-glutamate ligase [Lachnospiraceae bacterium]|nr:UDP-N-acetylmuramoyl-L-alanine--D-glutamate ligase [Lachnospiraceae bacterium]